MLSTPIHVYPHNRTIDINDLLSGKEKIKFKFYGDLAETFSLVIMRTDNNWSTTIDYVAGDYYNGDWVELPLTSATLPTSVTDNLVNGKTYIWQIRLKQVIYDIFMARGYTQSSPFVSKNIPTPESDVVWDESNVPVYAGTDLETKDVPFGYWMMWQGQKRQIISYDRNTGLATVQPAFTSKPKVGQNIMISPSQTTWNRPLQTGEIFVEIGKSGLKSGSRFTVGSTNYTIQNYISDIGVLKISSSAVSISADTAYVVNNNYIDSQQYTFNTMATPTLTSNIYEDIKFGAPFPHLRGVLSIPTGIKKYRWLIYRKENNLDILDDDSGYIYSGDMEHIFRKVLTGYSYYGHLTVTLQNGMELTHTSSNFGLISGDEPSLIEEPVVEEACYTNYVKLSWQTIAPSTYNITYYRIFRQEKNDNSIQYIGYKIANGDNWFLDYTAQSTKEYRWYIVPYADNASTLAGKTLITDWYVIKNKFYSLDFLQKSTQIGVNNLWTGTKDWSGTWVHSGLWTTNGTYNGFVVKKRVGQFYGMRQVVVGGKTGDVYTLSAYAKVDGGEVRFYVGGAGFASGTGTGTLKTQSTEWVKISQTFQLTSDGIISARFENPIAGGTIWICGLYLTKGDKQPQTWQPAIEDAEYKDFQKTILGNTKQYSPISSFIFNVNPEMGDISQTSSRQIFENPNSRYPMVYDNNMNYKQLSFSSEIGQVDIENDEIVDTIHTVENWEDCYENKYEAIVKTPKGDVLFGKVISSGKGYSNNRNQDTTLNWSFVETTDIKNGNIVVLEKPE